jgi:hypothetical protein
LNDETNEFQMTKEMEMNLRKTIAEPPEGGTDLVIAIAAMLLALSGAPPARAQASRVSVVGIIPRAAR